jgi:ribonucleotide reductase alpha subunit
MTTKKADSTTTTNSRTENEFKHVKYDYSEALGESLKYFNGDSLAAEVFLKKYALKNSKGDLLESNPVQMHKRLAKEFARIEKKYPNPLSEQEIFDFLSGFKRGIAQGSPMSGIGNPYHVTSLSNCEVIESPYDSYGGILFTDQESAQLYKRRCGVGFDISTLRPRGMPTKNASGTTDGIGVFMERFSNTCREVAMEGRRGALMLTVSVHHPEIRTFINIKKDKTKVNGANISIRLTDEFMKAVKNDSTFDLRFPVEKDDSDSVVFETISAKKLWDEIIDSAWDSAEPGLLFWDTIIRETPAECYKSKGFKHVSTNPCLSSRTWITTDNGPRQIRELLDKNFHCLNDGKKYSSTRFYKTGHKKLFKIKTSRGYELESTIDHKIHVNGKGWVEAGKLVPGDKITLQNHGNISWGGEGTFNEGWLVGEMVGDGCYNPESYVGLVSFWGKNKYYMSKLASDRVAGLDYNFRSDFKGGMSHSLKNNKILVNSRSLDKLAGKYITKKEKAILPSVEKASSEFCKGFLRGIFDADGSVQGNKSKGCSIRLSQNSLDMDRLKVVQRMLSRFGIVSTIYEKRKPEGFCPVPDGKGGNRHYFCKSMKELCVTKDMMLKFHDIIGFEEPEKKKRLQLLVSNSNNRELYKTNFTTKFIELEEIGFEDVYDCTVEDVHCFDANGIKTHNCSELILSAYDSCRLFLLNVNGYVNNAFKKNAHFDFDSFKEDAIIGQRLMDDLVDLELEAIQRILDKIDSDPEPEHIKKIERDLWTKIYTNCENGRRTGLGITGLGDAIAACNKRYGSDESIKLTEMIYKILCAGSYESSIIMAEERGSFPAYEYDLEKDHVFLKRIMEVVGPEVYEKYLKHGRRNIANTTTAPAGSVSILSQTTSGIEPVFRVSYKRRKKISPSDKNSRVDFTDPLGDKWQEYDVYHHGFETWMKETGLTGIENSPYHKSTSDDIDWVSSVKLQSVAQKWICHSLSKTCNLPNTATRENVSEVYMKAYELGCKGFTVYREGCRTGVLISGDAPKASETQKEIETTKLPFKDNHAPKRPEVLPCDIYHMTVQGEKWNLFVGLFEGRPYEIFAGRSQYVSIPKSKTKGTIKKNGKYNLYIGDDGDEIVIRDLAQIFENTTESAFTRTVSLSLRHGIPVQFIVEQIEKGANKESGMFTMSKALMRCLKNYIKDGTKASLKLCRECGADGLRYQEGCVLCTVCGSSKCG